MPDLLHEFWENDGVGEFGPVRERNDLLRPGLIPGAKRIFSLRASSWHQAMRLYQERLDYGDYRPPDGEPDILYTDEEAMEQEAYLAVRTIP